MSVRPQAPKLPQPKNFMLDVPKSTEVETADTAALKLSDLSETERSAASLGVDPSAWRPIGWLNEGHYEALLKENRIGDDLAKRVEAFKNVAAGTGVKA